MIGELVDNASPV